MGSTPIKTLRTLEQGQSSPELVVNELVYHIDLALNMVIADKDLATPPSTPSAGATYFIASSPTGAWASQAGKIATYRNSAWGFYTPPNGTIIYVTDESAIYVYQAGSLVGLSTVMGAISMLGINATADATNRLAVSSASSLFNHAGTNHQIIVNKNAVGNTASVVFQVGFSGRAEFGLIGNNNFGLKTSANGSAWVDSMAVNNADGSVSFPRGQYNGTLSIADDAFATVVPPVSMLKSGIFMVHSYDVAGDAPQLTESAVFWFDVGSTAATRSINLGTASAITTGPLTGTTGADAFLTVAPHSDGNIYIENRRGGARTFRFAFIG